jgi:hypothetical protein
MVQATVFPVQKTQLMVRSGIVRTTFVNVIQRETSTKILLLAMKDCLVLNA